MGNPEQMQQAMSQMMNNPMMQNVLSDPEMLRNMFSSNPAIQQVHAVGAWPDTVHGMYSHVSRSSLSGVLLMTVAIVCS